MSAVLTIDLAALRANWRFLADTVAPAECAAVVKADAYGIGLEPAASALWREGARTFFVARASEGARLRSVLPEAIVYVLDGTTGCEALLREHDLRPVLGTQHDIAAWLQAGGAPAALHVDTGMNRLGLSMHDISALADQIARLNATLVLSHFTSSENPDAPDNAAQIARFEAVRHLAPFASLANSSGIFLARAPWYDLVRPGYALYGGNPTPDRPNPMRPVVMLEAPILQVRDVPVGATVGYNGRWTARRASRIATIALGYADGIPRAAAGLDERPGPDVALQGKRCPIVGGISMDLITVDVSDATEWAAEGTVVEVLGRTIGIDEFGARAGTIGYEILTGLSARCARIYRDASPSS